MPTEILTKEKIFKDEVELTITKGVNLEKIDKVLRDLNLEEKKVVLMRQVHEDKMTVVDDSNGGKWMEEVDALITKTRDLNLVIKTADCLPVIIYESEKKILAAVHAGWRGVVVQIVPKVIIKMQAEWGAKPEKMWFYLGPRIGSESFITGEEVAAQFAQKKQNGDEGTWQVDLAAEVKMQIVKMGGKIEKISDDKIDTWSRMDLPSYRRDKTDKRILTIVKMGN